MTNINTIYIFERVIDHVTRNSKRKEGRKAEKELHLAAIATYMSIPGLTVHPLHQNAN